MHGEHLRKSCSLYMTFCSDIYLKKQRKFQNCKEIIIIVIYGLFIENFGKLRDDLNVQSQYFAVRDIDGKSVVHCALHVCYSSRTQRKRATNAWCWIPAWWPPSRTCRTWSPRWRRTRLRPGTLWTSSSRWTAPTGSPTRSWSPFFRRQVQSLLNVEFLQNMKYLTIRISSGAIMLEWQNFSLYIDTYFMQIYYWMSIILLLIFFIQHQNLTQNSGH